MGLLMGQVCALPLGFERQEADARLDKVKPFGMGGPGVAFA